MSNLTVCKGGGGGGTGEGDRDLRAFVDLGFRSAAATEGGFDVGGGGGC